VMGMITRSTSRTSGHYFALHINAIRARVDAYLRESEVEQRVYCGSCGVGSRAGAAGLFYCENCGATMPHAQNMQRYVVPQAEAFYEMSRVRCNLCGAQVGFHAGRCLRCGREPETRVLGNNPQKR
jgi:predicted amidophosphoribosyltransferase